MSLELSCSKGENSTTFKEGDYSIDLSLTYETDWDITDEIYRTINEHRVSVGLTEKK